MKKHNVRGHSVGGTLTDLRSCAPGTAAVFAITVTVTVLFKMNDAQRSENKSINDGDWHQMIRKDSILYCTGQAGKFWVAIIGAMISAALVFGAQSFKDSLSDRWYVITMLFGTLVAFVGLAFPSFAIKCPRCGARWYWMAISKKHNTRGYKWLTSHTSCPVCGTSFTGPDTKTRG